MKIEMCFAIVKHRGERDQKGFNTTLLHVLVYHLEAFIV